jgi:hypothetical protein
MLRSVTIGNFDYPSEFNMGIKQAMSALGHHHVDVEIKLPIDEIKRKVDEVKPTIIFGHMLLWAPGKNTPDLLNLCTKWKQKGTKIVIHDGDCREAPRFPQDVSYAIDACLCNHAYDRSVWNIKQIRWPYFAFLQKEIAQPHPDFICDLLFAGRKGPGMYEERTMMIDDLSLRFSRKSGVFKVFPGGSIRHTLLRTPEVAASAGAVLGYGRPDAQGWTDVRVFQYPGAGGVLLHDDADEWLEPMEHYIPYESGNVDSIIEAAILAREIGPYIRKTAFEYVQSYHTCVDRVIQVLEELEIGY